MLVNLQISVHYVLLVRVVDTYYSLRSFNICLPQVPDHNKFVTAFDCNYFSIGCDVQIYKYSKIKMTLFECVYLNKITFWRNNSFSCKSILCPFFYINFGFKRTFNRNFSFNCNVGLKTNSINIFM